VANHVHDGVDILMHRLGPEPQGPETALTQDLITDRVADGSVGFEMVRSVDFDNQPPVKANKVQNVVQERRLPAKMKAFIS
jgi:hypothetical protein